MARLDMGACAEVIATGRIGVVEDRKRTKVTLCFYDKEYIEPEYITLIRGTQKQDCKQSSGDQSD